MKAIDFEYDSLRLSDFGYILCSFDSGGIDTISCPEISFNTVSTIGGAKHELTSSEYEDCITFTLQICKNICYGGSMEILLEDARNITRWLNRKGFHKFKLIDNEWSGIYLEASFNVSKIEMDGKLVGFELEAVTNRPFALQEPVVFTINNTKPNEIKSFNSLSDEEGYIYPNIKIKIEADGDLEIYSITEDRTMKILNCVAGEVINIDYPVITSSVSSHKIHNDFNWIFYRIATSFKSKENELTISLPCSIEINYSPIIKISI